ncbi:MAG: hypothetical protein FJX34_04180 [Alphaproteobacteria bacterium]|nr:hypothetical protein [Alphaproteobacteria bacterium]
MSKTLVIINEPFAEMVIGKNTTLSQILAAADRGDEVYLYNLDLDAEGFPSDKSNAVKTSKLSVEQAQILIAAYRLSNEEMIDNPDSADLVVGDLVAQEKFEQVSLLLSEITTEDQIIQRLEPMKAPFPPHGKDRAVDVLWRIKRLFPNHIFNCPIFVNEQCKLEELYDKDAPKEVSKILNEEIAVPTAEFKLNDADYSTALLMHNTSKIVIKPSNLAQSLGVFAVEFAEDGWDFAVLNQHSKEDLAATQTYKIKSNLASEELKKIILTLCSVSGIDASYYQGKMLVQPFLEGVRYGDVRANFIKDETGNFGLVGFTYRKSARADDGKFTTCYIDGGSVARPISELSDDEQDSLIALSEKVWRVLNNELKTRYQNCREIGADFILVGNDKDVLLNEINHHCPGLAPLSEMLNRIVDPEIEYDGGLWFARVGIDAAMSQQKLIVASAVVDFV